MTYHAEFNAGLGDIIIRAYQESKYMYLANLPFEHDADVVFWSDNPFSYELLEWCPARARLRLRQMEFERRLKPIFRKSVGLSPRDETHLVPASTEKPVWYPPVHEVNTIVPLMSKPFVVISAGAGSGARCFPKNMLDDIIASLARAGHVSVLVGRSYKNLWNRLEPQPEKHSHVINLIDKLSVPGVLKLVGFSKGVVASHSAVYHAGIFENKPMLLLYPPSTVRYHIEAKTGYCHGMDFPTTVHTTFPDLKEEHLERFKAML